MCRAGMSPVTLQVETALSICAGTQGQIGGSKTVTGDRQHIVNTPPPSSCLFLTSLSCISSGRRLETQRV